MGELLDTLKSVGAAAKAFLKSGSEVVKAGSEKVEELVSVLPLPDEIPKAPVELFKNPVDKFYFYQSYYERHAMLWSAKYSQAKSKLDQLKMKKDELKGKRVDALEDIGQIKDDLKLAKERRDRFSPPDHMYNKYAQEVADIEAQLASYQEKRSNAQDSDKPMSRQTREAERQLEEAETKRDYFQEQHRRSTYHFNKAVEEAAKKK